MTPLESDDRGIIVSCPHCAQRNRLAYDRLGEAVRCAACKHELTPPPVPLDITASADFDRLISKSAIPIVVDYWAPWCGPCRMVAPELAKVAARAAGRFVVVKVNTDVLSDLGEHFGIRSIPTMAIFAGGREISRTTGARPAADIEAFIERATARPLSETEHY
jgi:thioredoxin 2